MRRAPYFWALLTNPSERAGLQRGALISIARISLLGLCVDVIYQAIVLKTFYLGEAVIIALALAFLPYLLLCGPIAGIALRLRREGVSDQIQSRRVGLSGTRVDAERRRT